MHGPEQNFILIISISKELFDKNEHPHPLWQVARPPRQMLRQADRLHEFFYLKFRVHRRKK